MKTIILMSLLISTNLFAKVSSVSDPNNILEQTDGFTEYRTTAQIRLLNYVDKERSDSKKH